MAGVEVCERDSQTVCVALKLKLELPQGRREAQAKQKGSTPFELRTKTKLEFCQGGPKREASLLLSLSRSLEFVDHDQRNSRHGGELQKRCRQLLDGKAFAETTASQGKPLEPGAASQGRDYTDDVHTERKLRSHENGCHSKLKRDAAWAH